MEFLPPESLAWFVKFKVSLRHTQLCKGALLLCLFHRDDLHITITAGKDVRGGLLRKRAIEFRHVAGDQVAGRAVPA